MKGLEKDLSVLVTVLANKQVRLYWEVYDVQGMNSMVLSWGIYFLFFYPGIMNHVSPKKNRHIFGVFNPTVNYNQIMKNSVQTKETVIWLKVARLTYSSETNIN